MIKNIKICIIVFILVVASFKLFSAQTAFAGMECNGDLVEVWVQDTSGCDADGVCSYYGPYYQTEVCNGNWYWQDDPEPPPPPGPGVPPPPPGPGVPPPPPGPGVPPPPPGPGVPPPPPGPGDPDYNPENYGHPPGAIFIGAQPGLPDGWYLAPNTDYPYPNPIQQGGGPYPQPPDSNNVDQNSSADPCGAGGWNWQAGDWDCNGDGVGDSPAGAAAAAAGVMSGSLIPAALSCIILDGLSSCNINFTWAVFNPEVPSGSAVTSNIANNGVSAPNTPVAPPLGPVNPDSGNNVPFIIPHSPVTIPPFSRTFFLYNHQKLLDERYVTSSCESGSGWDGNSCESGVIDGGWSGCSVACGGGTRVCNNPPPSNGGATCSGSSTCNTDPCVAPGGLVLDSDKTIIYSGEEVTLTWDCPAPPSTSSVGDNFSTDTTGDGIGEVEDSITLSPPMTTTYTLICKVGAADGAGGSVTITVKKKPFFIEN